MGFLNGLFLRMRALVFPTVSVSAVLASQFSNDPEGVVLQLYAWERDRLMGLAKGLASAAVTILTGLIAAAIEGSITASGRTVALAALAIAELFIWAGLILIELRRLAEEYPTALGLT